MKSRTLDGDGTEDAHDDDIDGDGFSNDKEELAYPDRIRLIANRWSMHLPLILSCKAAKLRKTSRLAHWWQGSWLRIADTNDYIFLSADRFKWQTKRHLRLNFPTGGLRTTRKLDYESDARDSPFTNHKSDGSIGMNPSRNCSMFN